MKFRYKKLFLNIWSFLFIAFTLIELVIYMFSTSELFGVIYLSINVVILFLLIPVIYNYKRHYSKNRISKLIIILLLGVFSSYALGPILLSSTSIVDESHIYINKITILKSILKGIMYVLLGAFIYLESRRSNVK